MVFFSTHSSPFHSSTASLTGYITELWWLLAFKALGIRRTGLWERPCSNPDRCRSCVDKAWTCWRWRSPKSRTFSWIVKGRCIPSSMSRSGRTRPWSYRSLRQLAGFVIARLSVVTSRRCLRGSSWRSSIANLTLQLSSWLVGYGIYSSSVYLRWSQLVTFQTYQESPLCG